MKIFTAILLLLCFPAITGCKKEPSATASPDAGAPFVDPVNDLVAATLP